MLRPGVLRAEALVFVPNSALGEEEEEEEEGELDDLPFCTEGS